MRRLTVEEIVSAVGGRVMGAPAALIARSVSTDSRTIGAGAVFFAIVGSNFDGHDFVGEALEKGAAAAVVSDAHRAPAAHQGGGRLIVVDDTTAALGRLGSWYRRQLAAQVIAVVGSNGKTTTKDMIATVLGERRACRAAPGSFNNQIGVPMTLLSAEAADEFVVVEIGTNHPGEVAALARIASPDAAVVTSIGEEHLEFFEGLEGVAKEEFSIVGGLGERGFLAMSEQAAGYSPGAAGVGFGGGCTRVVYGFGSGADLRSSEPAAESGGQRFEVNGRQSYWIPLAGRHNVLNALGAIAVAMRMRIRAEDVASGLSRLKLPPMRQEQVRVGELMVINDAYNANPSSMKAALEMLDSLGEPGRKVLVLGDMLELGDQTLRCHQAVGQDAGRSSAQVIITVGPNAKEMRDAAIRVAGPTKRVYWAPSVEALGEKIGTMVQAGDIVLLKASRGMKLERLLPQLAEVGRVRVG